MYIGRGQGVGALRVSASRDRESYPILSSVSASVVYAYTYSSVYRPTSDVTLNMRTMHVRTMYGDYTLPVQMKEVSARPYTVRQLGKL